MANAMKGEATFEADGVSYTLVFDWEAIFAVEDELDRDFPSVMAEIAGASSGGAMKLKTLATLIMCGLRRHHPDMTRGDAMDLMQEHQEEIGTALGVAIEAAQPRADDPGARPTKAAAKTRPSPAGKRAKPKH